MVVLSLGISRTTVFEGVDNSTFRPAMSRRGNRLSVATMLLLPSTKPLFEMLPAIALPRGRCASMRLAKSVNAWDCGLEVSLLYTKESGVVIIAAWMTCSIDNATEIQGSEGIVTRSQKRRNLGRSAPFC